MSDFAGMEDLLQDFLVEAGDLLSGGDNKLVDLERSPDDRGLLNDIFRGFHTIKGGAGFLNASELVTLCHLTESLLGLTNWWSNLAEGIIRLGIVVGYIWIIGRMPEIQRVFAYHGAEHKTINAYEAGVDLTVENVSKQSLEHPRCGTAFLLTLVLLSILVFTLNGPLPPVWRILSRVIAVPLLGTIAYKKVDDPVVVHANSRSAMAEMFRLLRTNLQFMGGERGNKTIMVTSSASGEGSFRTARATTTLSTSFAGRATFRR